MTGENGPASRELAARLESLRELMDERDRRYTETFKSAEEKVGIAFNASEKAIEKAEGARTAHDLAVNEWRQQYNTQEGRFLPRLEFENKNKDQEAQMERMRTDIQGLRESRSAGAGQEIVATNAQTQNNAVMGFVIGGAGVLVGAAGIVAAVAVAAAS